MRSKLVGASAAQLWSVDSDTVHETRQRAVVGGINVNTKQQASQQGVDGTYTAVQQPMSNGNTASGRRGDYRAIIHTNRTSIIH